jgi:hypothetical protein
VPWYFITLAIIGAAISLARKVPEYQRRAISSDDALNGLSFESTSNFKFCRLSALPLSPRLFITL